jgi:hypothetical protein
MPKDNDLVQGFTLRVTALDTSGSLVAGVKVNEVVITANSLGGGDLSSGGASGFFALIPGPSG